MSIWAKGGFFIKGKIKNKVMVMSGKGGVGKSTIATNLAYGLSLKGHRVGLLDGDIHGPNIPQMLGIEGARISEKSKAYKLSDKLSCISLSLYLKDPNDPILYNAEDKKKLIKDMIEDIVWGDLDYLIVDLPPGTGEETITVAREIKGDSCGSIVVTTPQEVALLDSHKAIRFSKLLYMPILGIVENMSGMVCPHCNEVIDLFKRDGGKKLSEKTNTKFLGSIPLTQEIVEAGDNGKPYIFSNIGGIAYESLRDIIDKVEVRVEEERLRYKELLDRSGLDGKGI